jgi:putative membrane protein
LPDSFPVWNHWHAHPDVIIGLAVLLGAYLYAVGPLRVRQGLTQQVEPRQVAMFTGGVAVILLALTSPLHELSNNYLFSAHMVQHVLLTLVAPPLLIAGTPGWALGPVLRVRPVRAVARVLTHPIVAFAVFNLMFSFWHFPALYAGSVDFHAIHIVEHLAFMATGVMAWWPLMSNSPELPRLSEPLQMVYLLFMSIAQILVFAPITFAGQPIYQYYVDAPAIWGISDLMDQQAGGLIMKVGGGALFMTLLVVTFFRWYAREEAESAAERLDQKRLASGMRQVRVRGAGQSRP